VRAGGGKLASLARPSTSLCNDAASNRLLLRRFAARMATHLYAPIGNRMIARFLWCGLSLWIACCAAVPTAGFSQVPGTLAEADQSFKRALEIWSDGKSPEAEALLNRALSIRLEQLGPNHPLVARAIERLGALSFNRGKYAEAEVQFRRALDIDVRALGEESAVVAYDMGDVGAALREQGRYSEARTIVERSMSCVASCCRQMT
jgi:tetratricopeptide (TPR) repeat protein